MAVFKPNNFYPYQQEIDMESIDGNIFSCQVNTNGALVSGAKLKIASAIDSTELYENIYQFEEINTTSDGIMETIRVPYRNREIAEMEVLPYEIFPKYSETKDKDGNTPNKTCILYGMKFQSLCSNVVKYSEKKDMCPYNLYEVKKNKKSLFKIKAKIIDNNGNATYRESDFSNFKIISKDAENLFDIKFNDVSFFQEINNELKEEYEIHYYIVLKNNYDYLWNVRLYEHYFDEIVEQGTLVTDGYITGSTKNVLWYKDQDIDFKNHVKKDNYVEIVADENNSDIFENQILDGKTMRGEIKQLIEGISSTEISVLNGADGYILTEFEAPYFVHSKKYKVTDSGQIISSGESGYTWKANEWKIQEKDKYDNDRMYPTIFMTTDYQDKWYFLNNVEVYIDKTSNNFMFDFDNASIGDVVPRKGAIYEIVKNDRGKKYAEPIKELNNTLPSSKEDFIQSYTDFPFVLPDCRTYVIVKEKGEKDNEKYAEWTNSTIQEIKGQYYYVKVLSPLPFYPEFYEVECIEWQYLNSNYPKYNWTNYVYYQANNAHFAIKKTQDVNGNITYSYPEEITNIDLYCFDKETNGFSDTYNAIINPFSSGFYFYEESNPFKETSYPMSKICTNISEDTKSYTLKKATSQTFDIDHNTKYTWTGFCKGYTDGAISKEYLPYITIKDYTDSTYSEIYYLDVEKFETDGEIKQDIEIPYMKHRKLYAVITIPEITKGIIYESFDLKTTNTAVSSVLLLNDDNVNFSKYIDNMYFDFKFYKKNEKGITTLLTENDFKTSPYLAYEYLFDAPVQKIKYYNEYDHTFELIDKRYEDLLKDFLNQNESIIIKYNIFYKQREKITWTTEDLGTYHDINKIEVENEFNINLKNGTPVYLYPSSDQNTYNSFFGEKNVKFNVENLFIRFPGYEGYDGLGNYILDSGDYGKKGTTSIKYYNLGESIQKEEVKVIGPFYSSKKGYEDSKHSTSITWDSGSGDNAIGCPLGLYGTHVSEYAFEDHITEENGKKDGYYCKLFKVSSYNADTGEFVIAGGLERIILPTDKYEVWKREYIEGSDNEYDITEVKSTYTRLFPKPEDLEKEIQVETSSILIKDGLKILNSNENAIFIQPNINFSSDENTAPYLILDDTDERLDFNYRHIVDNIKYYLTDLTIDKLDGSQWLLPYSCDTISDLKPGMTYNLYTDWADSTPSSYFYGRELGEIELKYGELSDVNDMKNSIGFSALSYDSFFDVPKTQKQETPDGVTPKPIYVSPLFDFDSNIRGNYYIISGMNIYLIARIKNTKAQIKKYRYKIYDSNMELAFDSDDIWDNIMEYEVRGLKNNEYYYIIFTCEDEYNFEYVYESSFYVNYEISNIPNEHITITPLCSHNAMKIEIDPIYFTDLNYGLQESDEIVIYRKDSTGKTEWVNTLNKFSDKIYMGMEDNNYKYGFIDYNVRNNEYYDYLFIFNKKTYSFIGYNKYQYILAVTSIKTNFDSWSIIDIIKNQETGIYEVSGDIWNFRYNLETSDIVNNTSVKTWDTLGRYAQMGSGEKGYDSSGLTCLLGDVSMYTSFDGTKNIEKYGYHEKISTAKADVDFAYQQGKTNNIEKYNRWKKFCRNNSAKLLKDMAGNLWIVGIAENPNTNINNNTKEQLKKISFQWKEIQGLDGISIIGRLSSLDRDKALTDNISSSLDLYWEDFEIYNNTTYDLKIIKEITLDSFEIEGRIFDATGTLVTAIEDSSGELEYKSPFINKKNEYSQIKKYVFNNDIIFTYNSIDSIFKDNTIIESINIVLDDRITSAKDAFSGCTNLTTDNGGYIEINTSNYINTTGMLNGTEKNITITWSPLLTNESCDLLTYVELYEQYWNRDNIVLNCPQLSFNLEEWNYIIAEEAGIEDNIDYEHIVYLQKYKGTKENIFIPKFFKIDKITYNIVLDDNFSIK